MWHPFPWLHREDVIFIVGLQERKVILSISFMSFFYHESQRKCNWSVRAAVPNVGDEIKQRKQNHSLSSQSVGHIPPVPRPLAPPPGSLGRVPTPPSITLQNTLTQNMLPFRLHWCFMEPLALVCSTAISSGRSTERSSLLFSVAGWNPVEGCGHQAGKQRQSRHHSCIQCVLSSTVQVVPHQDARGPTMLPEEVVVGAKYPLPQAAPKS